VSDVRVLDVRNCTVGVENFTGGDFSYVHEEAGLLGIAVISNCVCFISIR